MQDWLMKSINTSNEKLIVGNYDHELEKQILTTLLDYDSSKTILGKFKLEELIKLQKNDFYRLGLKKEQADKLYFLMVAHDYLSEACYNQADYMSLEDIMNIIGSKLSKKTKEHFVTVLIDASGKVLSIKTHFIGDHEQCQTSANVVFSELFSEPTINTAAQLILVHNHPSGTPVPSKSDFHVTMNYIIVGKALNLPLVDHCIVGSNSWVSLKEEYPELWDDTINKLKEIEFFKERV